MAEKYGISNDDYGLPILEFDEGCLNPNELRQATLESLGFITLEKV